MARLGVMFAAGILMGGAAGDVSFAEVGEFNEALVCVGRSLGGGKVKVNCQHEYQRGNRIYRGTISGTLDGPGAKGFIGKHTNCRQAPQDDGTVSVACNQ